MRALDSDDDNRRLLIAEYLNDIKKRMPYREEREKVTVYRIAHDLAKETGPPALVLTTENRYVSYLTSLRRKGVLI